MSKADVLRRALPRLLPVQEWALEDMKRHPERVASMRGESDTSPGEVPVVGADPGTLSGDAA